MHTPIQHAKHIYNIDHWSDGFFDINDQGHLVAYPNRDRNHPGIDLLEVCQTLQKKGLSFPILLRFNEILTERVNLLCNAFTKAIHENAYEGSYKAVYPIKVNQQQAVIRQLLEPGEHHIGLEAGSKPELMAVLALANPKNSLIICNGYKDSAYIRLALMGQKMGHRVYLIIEKLSELPILLEQARALNVTPRLGIRIRLASIGVGKWQNTGGEKSKFGLSPLQVLTAIEQLKDANQLNSLELIHFHLGSQIANIRDIQRGMRECARYYAELRRLGAPITCVDVGGGLGIDYEGTRSRSSCSMNYSLDEYAHNIVHTIKEICLAENLPHPQIITESGRAMTAHHAVLVTNIIETERLMPEPPQSPAADAPMVLHDLWQSYQHLADRSALEVYHDAHHFLTEAQTMYVHGLLTLAQRAEVEQLYLAICFAVQTLLSHDQRAQRDLLDELNGKLANKLFGNFSLFQSLPDIWAIKQIFPVLPLSGLDKPLTERGILQDITCDSDGRIDCYVEGQGLDNSLRLPANPTHSPYLLGVFLVGAYQEILGDIHNLFGDTHAVHIKLCKEGGYQLQDITFGETIADVLRHVHFDPTQLLETYQTQLDNTTLTVNEKKQYLAELQKGLGSYTYLDIS